MGKKRLAVWIVAGIAVLFIASAIYAGTEVPDVIKMENPAYKERKRGIVEFTHKKHMEEYAEKDPDLFENGCGVCHHDDNGKPLKDLKIGDDVQTCIECHKKPAERPKGRNAPKLSKEERLEYHAEALHYNCRGCHRQFNRKHNTKAAPTTCAKCHPKKEQK